MELIDVSRTLSDRKDNGRGRHDLWRATLLAVSFALCGFATFEVDAQSGTLSQEQHFGPLIVLSMHEPALDPELVAYDLLNKKPNERSDAYRSMGLEGDPIHQLWITPTDGTRDSSPEQKASKWISTTVPDVVFDQDSKPYKVVHIGVDDLGDHPFWIESVFSDEEGGWFRVATIACLCPGDREGDIEFSSSPKKPKVRELVFRFNTSLGQDSIWSDRTVRFRIKSGEIRVVFDKESDVWTYPLGPEPGKLCTGVRTTLFFAPLIDSLGHKHPGAVLTVDAQSTRHLQRGELPLIDFKNVSCTPYVWDDLNFSYVRSQWSVAGCNTAPAAITPNEK